MQIKIYYAEILDYNNQPVLRLDYVTSPKHAAFTGKAYVDNCPPANTFAVRMHVVDARVVCHQLNNKRE